MLSCVRLVASVSYEVFRLPVLLNDFLERPVGLLPAAEVFDTNVLFFMVLPYAFFAKKTD